MNRPPFTIDSGPTVTYFHESDDSRREAVLVEDPGLNRDAIFSLSYMPGQIARVPVQFIIVRALWNLIQWVLKVVRF